MLARGSEVALRRVHGFVTELLSQQKELWSRALKSHETLTARGDATWATAAEAQRQVRRHQQALKQILQRFTELASQVVAWTGALVPKLRLLVERRAELRVAVEIQVQLPELEREKIEAEDELDAAATELRKHRRHTSASRFHQTSRSLSKETAGGVARLQQLELTEQHAEERLAQLTQRFNEAEHRLEDAVLRLTMAIDPEYAEDSGSGLGSREEMSPEERVALKLAEIHQTHVEFALQVSEAQAERDRVLKQVEERRADEALHKRIEPDFMCPIMHERMNEPVLAADGHTYERQAIQRWLQMHNTSPMTVAPLAHRYLTENFALRHLIASCEAGLPKSEGVNCEDDGEEEEEEEKE